MRLYYMTSARWAEVILKERRLKFSRFHESNDPFELRLIDTTDRAVRKYNELICSHFEKRIGFLCFGATWASPVMWAHYAEKHSGVALGLEVPEDLATPIRYVKGKVQVPFGAHLPTHCLSEDLLSRVRLTKAADWAYEREYRVEGSLQIADPKTGLYYKNFGPQLELREVIIGCRCTWTVPYVKALVDVPSAPVRICKARPGFRKFEMVEQKRVKVVVVKPEAQPKA